LSQAGPTDQPLELPSRLVTEDDLAAFCKAMSVYETPSRPSPPSTSGTEKKRGYLGGLDTKQYGRGKRSREVSKWLQIENIVVFLVPAKWLITLCKDVQLNFHAFLCPGLLTLCMV
jgi:Snf2-ATP coupling, chromatin remodelling complex